MQQIKHLLFLLLPAIFIFHFPSFCQENPDSILRAYKLNLSLPVRQELFGSRSPLFWELHKVDIHQKKLHSKQDVELDVMGVMKVNKSMLNMEKPNDYLVVSSANKVSILNYHIMEIVGNPQMDSRPYPSNYITKHPEVRKRYNDTPWYVTTLATAFSIFVSTKKH